MGEVSDGERNSQAQVSSSIHSPNGNSTGHRDPSETAKCRPMNKKKSSNQIRLVSCNRWAINSNGKGNESKWTGKKVVYVVPCLPKHLHCGMRISACARISLSFHEAAFFPQFFFAIYSLLIIKRMRWNQQNGMCFIWILHGRAVFFSLVSLDICVPVILVCSLYFSQAIHTRWSSECQSIGCTFLLAFIFALDRDVLTNLAISFFGWCVFIENAICTIESNSVMCAALGNNWSAHSAYSGAMLNGCKRKTKRNKKSKRNKILLNSFQCVCSGCFFDLVDISLFYYLYCVHAFYCVLRECRRIPSHKIMPSMSEKSATILHRPLLVVASLTCECSNNHFVSLFRSFIFQLVCSSFACILSVN